MQRIETLSTWHGFYKPALYGAFLVMSTVVVSMFLSDAFAERARQSPEAKACQLLATQVAEGGATLAAYLSTRCAADHLSPALLDQ